VDCMTLTGFLSVTHNLTWISLRASHAKLTPLYLEAICYKHIWRRFASEEYKYMPLWSSSSARLSDWRELSFRLELMLVLPLWFAVIDAVFPTYINKLISLWGTETWNEHFTVFRSFLIVTQSKTK